MNTRFGLIYFIHDDPSGAFDGVVGSILKAPWFENIKIMVIHNRRQVVTGSNGKRIVQTTGVTEVAKDSSGQLHFEPVQKDPVAGWQEAFLIAFSRLREGGYFEKIGLITLSHSNGFVITDTLRLNAAASFNGVDEDLQYIGMPIRDGDAFVTTTTIVSKENETVEAGLQSIFTRNVDTTFCRTHEALFLTQLSRFLKKELLSPGETQDPHGRKLVFFISSNCNFQLYDNLFEFAPVTEYIMGAQSLNSISFWDFRVIINAIAAKIEQDHESICNEIFSGCRSLFDITSPLRNKHYFLTRTKDFPGISAAFESIVKKILMAAKDAGVRQQLLTRIAGLPFTSEFPTIPFYDVIDIFKAADEIMPDELSGLIQDFDQLLRPAVIDRYIQDGLTLSGYSLFFPQKKEEVHESTATCTYFDKNSDKMGDFAKTSSYDELLRLLF